TVQPTVPPCLTTPPRPSAPPLFSFNASATTALSTLSLHDALPICSWSRPSRGTPCPIAAPPSLVQRSCNCLCWRRTASCLTSRRSEEHTSELQSRGHLVCRLLLEKKKSRRPR